MRLPSRRILTPNACRARCTQGPVAPTTLLMVVFRDSALVVKDTMFSRYRNRGSRNVGRYKARWVEYCDDALTMLQRQRLTLSWF